MAQNVVKVKWTCLRILLWILLGLLLLTLIAFFTITSLFDLGVWSEFWDEIRHWLGR